MEQNNTYDQKTGRAFGYANAVFQFVNSTSGSYIAYFITDVCLISAASFGLISSVAGIATVASIFIWAFVYQYTNLKNGRYRSWLRILPPAVFIGYIGLYTNLGMTESAWVVLLIISYSLVNFAGSGMGVAATSLMTKVGNTASSRADMLAFQNVTHCIARVISAAIVLPIITFVGGSQTAAIGYTVYFGAFAFLTIFIYLYLYKVTKKYDVYDANFKAGSFVKPKDMLRAIGGNKDLLILFVSDMIYNLLYICRVFSAAYFFNYIVGSMAMFVVYNMLDPFGSAVGAALSKIVVKKFDKTKAIFPLFIANGAVFAAIGICALSGIVNAYLIIALVVLAGLLNTVERSYHTSLYMDCAEIAYHKTGEDITPICMSLAALPFRFAFSFAGTVVAAVLAASGYTAGAVTAGAARGIIINFSILPAIGVLLFGFVSKFLLKLDVKTIDKIMQENAARKSAKQAELEAK